MKAFMLKRAQSSFSTAPCLPVSICTKVLEIWVESSQTLMASPFSIHATLGKIATIQQDSSEFLIPKIIRYNKAVVILSH